MESFSVEAGGGAADADDSSVQTHGLLYKLYYSKRLRLLYALAIFAIAFAALTNTHKTSDYLVTGGAIGLISSVTVMSLCYMRYSDFQLLFWRSFSECFVSLRFLLTWPLNRLACHSNDCYTDSVPLLEYCGVPSAWLEFFEIASELWFGIIAYDILASLVNPFSSTKSRMWKYHIFVWTISSAFAVPTWILPSIHGFWFVANNVDNTAICWIKAHKGSISPYIYFLFYIPLVLVYLFSLSALYVAYQRLKTGISNTLIHRMRALVINALNVFVYMLYWFVAGLMLTCAYSFNTTTAERFNERLLLYMIAAKGISSIFVWILTEDVSFNLKRGNNRRSHHNDSSTGEKEKDKEKAGALDLNSALRSELLYFATSGIRNSARRGAEVKPDQHEQVLRLQYPQQAQTTSNQFSVSFFFFLILGREAERRQIALMALNSRKKNSTTIGGSVTLGGAGAHRGDSETGSGLMRPSGLPPLPHTTSGGPGQHIAHGGGGEGDDRPSDVESTLGDEHENEAAFGSINPMLGGPGTGRMSQLQLNTQANSASSFRAGGGLGRPSTPGGGDSEASGGGEGVEMSVSTRFTESGDDRLSQRPTISSKREIQSLIRMSDSDVEQLESGGKPSSSSASSSMSRSEKVQSRRVSDVVVMNPPGSPTDVAENANANEAHANQGWFHSIKSYFVQTFGTKTPEVHFVEVEPYHFRRVRESQGFSDQDYIQQFRTTIKERVTQGGASGAFFFFSRDELCIAKSCTAEEMMVIGDNAKAYADYLCSPRGKRSFISKIFGAYTLQIYGISLHFFVMNNLFSAKDPNTGAAVSIHEKYDIKGSTVNRSAAPPTEGQVATCKNCEQKYVYHRKKRRKIVNNPNSPSSSSSTGPNGSTHSASGILASSESSLRGAGAGLTPASSTDSSMDEELNRCTFTVSGEHEPNVILKDNDLKYKIRLPRHIARRVVTQLEADASFLLSVGVMDYSLLVGVHNREYSVRDLMENGSSPGGMSDRSVSLDTSDNVDIDDCAGCAFTTMEVSRVVGPDLYMMGIIDFQQQWTLSKKLERFTKVTLKGEDPYGVSAIEPDTYRDRFVNHIRDIIDLDDRAGAPV